MRARATANICLSPPDRVSAFCLSLDLSMGNVSKWPPSDRRIFLFFPAAKGIGPQQKVVPHAHGAEQFASLGNAGDAHADNFTGRHPFDSLAVKNNGALSRPKHACNGLQKGCFPRAVASKYRDDPASFYREGYMIQCLGLSIENAQTRTVSCMDLSCVPNASSTGYSCFAFFMALRPDKPLLPAYRF